MNNIIQPTNTLNEIADIVHANAVEKGFHDLKQSDEQFLNYQLLNLIREVTELHEAWRNGKLNSSCDKAYRMAQLGLKPLTYAEEEYADCVIRILDQCRRLKIDIANAIAVKHAYNLTREYRHGNKLS